MSLTAAENKRLARRYFEQILNHGDFLVAETVLAPNCIFRNPPVVARGVTEFTTVIADVRAAFPDLHFTIHDEIAEGDKVVTRWTVTGTQRGDFLGHPASGKQIDVTGINIFRIDGGRVQEIWVNMDRLGEAVQLGWIESLTG
jgi:steroid delta-isomerase-like uncharacterized protein